MPHWQYVTSSVKPEVHNVSQHCRGRTEPRTQDIWIPNFVKIGPAVPEICSRTDKHTHEQTNWLQYAAPLRSEKQQKQKLDLKCKCTVITSFVTITTLCDSELTAVNEMHCQRISINHVILTKAETPVVQFIVDCYRTVVALLYNKSKQLELTLKIAEMSTVLHFAIQV